MRNRQSKNCLAYFSLEEKLACLVINVAVRNIEKLTSLATAARSNLTQQ